MKRKLASISSVLLMAAGLVVVGSGPASAYSCPYSWDYDYQGRVVAQICLSSLSGGSFELQSRSPYRGVPKHMKLTVCKYVPPGADANCVTDSGRYLYYAGPIADPGGCVHMYAVMYDGTGNRIVDDDKWRCN